MGRFIQPFTICVVILGLLTLETNGSENDGNTKVGGATNNNTGNGHWGPWTEWSLCDKTCGYGLQYRLRRCHRLKQENVSCIGDARQFKICNVGTCPPEHQDYRSIECSKHDHIFYGSRRYRWIPYINDQSPCELSCKSVGYGYYARFKTKVEDGVICNEENTATCMGAKCLKSGCDGILGSGSKEDICGVCGGRGNTCRIITGIYTRTHLTYRGYNIVAVIPAGARAINITEIGRSKNHLALSTPRGYFLNGHLRLQAEGEVRGAGTTFTYRRGRREGCRGECLSADGPLTTSLRVELIYFGRNPGIMYSYAIPNSNGQDADDADGRTGGLNGRGIAPLALTDSKVQLKERPNYVSDQNTNPNTQQLQQQNRRKHPQQQQQHGVSGDRYLQDAKSSPTRDPYKIIRHKEAKIIARQKQRHNTNTYSRSDNVTRRKHNISDKDSSSSNDGGVRRGNSRVKAAVDPSRKVIHNQRTFQNSKPYSSTGNKTDRDDVQYRHYYHTNALDGLGDVPVKSELSGGVRSSYKTARKLSDDRNRLHSSTSSQSSVSSASSSSSSTSYIDNNIPLPSDDDDNKNNHNNNHRSDNDTSDRTSQATNTRGKVGSSYNNQHNNRQSYRRRVGSSSQDGVYSWRISGFTDCTQPCGGGLQETRVVCIKSDSQVEVMEENCDVTAKPETTTVVCNNQPCKPSWSLSPWSHCSVSCGRGLRKREIDCQQRISPTLTIPVSLNNCPSPRPQSRQYCQLDPCYKWKPSNWTKCSTVCGFGQRSRTLACVDTQEKEVKHHFCNSVKPLTEEICDMGSCAQGWFHSKWTKECSAECGRGHYIRKVYCSAPDGSPLDENKCGGGEKKPRETKSCKAPLPCGGQWFTGPWSKCNDTCGSNAIRHREVLCVKQHGKRVKGITKNHNCDESKKPTETEQCPPMPACKPQWYMMAWSNCSKTCDTGVRTREVTCLDVNLNQNPDCDKKKKPSTRQSCNTLPCRQDFKEFSGTSRGGNTQILQQDGTIIDVPACEDKNGAKWCRLVSQARLCSYYEEDCCQTCSHRHHHDKAKG